MTDTLADSEEVRTDEAPKVRLSPNQVACPDCGKAISKNNITKHRREMHGYQPKAKAKSAPAASGPSLVDQIEMVYNLGGQVAISRGLPATGNVIGAQAHPCAVAWDQLLDAYFPGLKEMLEKGMVATSVVALIYAHIPIVQVARAEIAQRRILAPNPDADATSAF